MRWCRAADIFDLECRVPQQQQFCAAPALTLQRRRRLQLAAMTDGYAKILEQQKAMQAQVGKMHTHLMANSRVTSVILPVIMFAGGVAALSRGMYQLYTGALLCL